MDFILKKMQAALAKVVEWAGLVISIKQVL